MQISEKNCLAEIIFMGKFLKNLHSFFMKMQASISPTFSSYQIHFLLWFNVGEVTRWCHSRILYWLEDHGEWIFSQFR